MKTNLFKVSEKKEKKIIIEEERLKNPFLLFFKRYGKSILISGIMIAICFLLISTGIAFSLFRGSNDYDITYIEGDEIINSNNNPEIDDEDVKDELLGEIAKADGIVLQTKTFMSSQGDVISYFTDGTSIVVQSDGKIYRISRAKDGNYGINENGKVNETAKKILVESTTTTLMDGSIITYYSDGTAKVEHNTQTLFIRNSDNIKIDNGSSLNNLKPSGVAPTRETTKVGTSVVKTFTDGTILLVVGVEKYIINKNTEVTITETDINYSKKNIFSTLSEKTYADGNIITHFENGSAIITEPDGNITYVKKSGDLKLKEQKLHEIYPNEDGTSRKTFDIAGGQKVTYFDNGVAVIINSDGTRKYVEDNDDIIYDDNKNITSNPETSKQISERETIDGEKAYNFENGKSQVIRKDGTSYIVDTEKLEFKPESDIVDGDDKEDEEEPDEGEDNSEVENPGDGIHISEVETEPNEDRNMQTNKFIIQNNSNEVKDLRITIEEVSNYAKYNTDRLPPRFVKFQATVGANYVPATTLTDNTWIDEEGRENYVLYDGIILPKQTLEVVVLLYVNYAPLDNSYQNKGFIGTIRVYVEDGSGR